MEILLLLIAVPMVYLMFVSHRDSKNFEESKPPSMYLNQYFKNKNLSKVTKQTFRKVSKKRG